MASDRLDALPSSISRGIQWSTLWRDERRANYALTDTIQLFMPADPAQDAKVLITVSNNVAWEMLKTLGVLETPMANHK